MEIAYLIILALSAIGPVFIGVYIYKVFANEKKKKKWLIDIETSPTGEYCSYHFVSGISPEEMWISKKREDGSYEITFVGQERFIYPHKDKSDKK